MDHHLLCRGRGGVRAADRLSLARFGAVRTFIAGMIGFAVFSMLCGMSTSLAMLVICRLRRQELCGGPLMPLTQTLLLRIFPSASAPRRHGPVGDDHRHRADPRPPFWAVRSATTGRGTGSFFINLPVAAFCAFMSIPPAPSRRDGDQGGADRPDRPGPARHLDRGAADQCSISAMTMTGSAIR